MTEALSWSAAADHSVLVPSDAAAVTGLLERAQVWQQQQGEVFKSASPALFPRRGIWSAVEQIPRAKTAVPSASRLISTTSHDKPWEATGSPHI